jgi:DivIVA domain-containing protein
MAISFSRPDPSSPAAVADANFPTARRGFDQQEVREFLRMVAAEMARMQDRERYLEGEMRAVRQRGTPVPAELDDETLTRLLGEETARIVQAARESAAAIRNKAEEAAERMLREAKDEAAALRQEAEQEAARKRKDAEADAEAELTMAKQQGREMVEEARAYRERALGELSRRRDLARQQIDQLVHGRDRLVQAFERARLVAADVVAELVPLGELDEYVNLSPTTGPVPVMVPASKLADASAISDDALRARQRAVADEAPADAASTDSTHSIDRLLADKPAASTTPTDDGPMADESAEAVTEDAQADTAESTAAHASAPVGSEPGATAVGGATVLQFPGGVTRGDFARSPADSAEAEEAGSGDDDEPEPAPAEATADDEIDDDEVTATDVDDLFARLRTERPAASEPGTTTGDADADADADGAPTPFDRRDEALTPLIVSSGRKLKRVLADEQNTVLDRLRHDEPVRSLDDVIADAADHGARYFDIVEDDLMAAAEAGADSLGGATLDAGEGGVLAPIRESLLGDLIMPLRDRLADRIAAGDGDNEAITKSVRSVYREWKTKHIDDHLDDLLLLAYGRGAFAALEPGEKCRWVFDPAVGPCSDCEDNSLQGDVPAGTAFPTGHVAAPAHAGCRCLLTR